MEVPAGRSVGQFLINDMTWTVDIQKLWEHFIVKPTKIPRGFREDFYMTFHKLFMTLKSKPGFHICFIRQDGHTTFIEHTKEGVFKVQAVAQSCYNFAEIFTREKTLNDEFHPDGRLFLGMFMETMNHLKVT